jgi:hypothetical protein
MRFIHYLCRKVVEAIDALRLLRLVVESMHAAGDIHTDHLEVRENELCGWAGGRVGGWVVMIPLTFFFDI